MDVNTRNRAELKSYFVKNSIPTESNFAELIDGMLNQKDDGLVKLPGNPLTIEAAGDSNSEKRVLNIYPSFGDQNPAWTLSLNPRANPNEPATARPGFNISDGEGRSRLFIDRSTGNIGIGTLEPATAKLEVNGSFRASANASGQGEIWMEAPADGRHRIDPAEGEEDPYQTGLVYRAKENPRSGAPIFQVRSSGQAVRLFVDHDGWTGSRHNSAWFEGGRNNYFAGNVGIGTSEPSHKFHVVARDAVGLFESTGSQAYLRLSTSEGLDNRVEITNRPGGRLTLWTAGGGDVLNITKAGNVGIGLTEPAQRLHVAGGNGIVNNVFLGNVGHGAGWAGFSHNDAVSTTTYGFLHHTSGQYALINKKSGGGHIGFRIDNVDKVTIDDGGLMRAIEGLRIDGDRSTHLDNDGAFYRYQGQAYITVDDNLYIRDSGGDIQFHFNTNNGALDVKGKIQAGNSDLYFTKTDHNHSGIGNAKGYAAIENARDYDALMILGRAGTSLGRRVRLWDHLEIVGTFVNHSDQRAKQDIEDLAYGLEELKNLRPVAFNWKRIPNQHKTLGLIGQEVKSVISEVVYSDEQNSADPELSIAYTSLIPVLINAVKELDAKIERLASVDSLR